MPVRCPNCGTNNPPEEQLTYCKSCGAELRVVCPRCATDNAADEEYCRECGLELHPDRGHERAAGIRRDGAPAEEAWLSRYSQFIIGGIVVAAILWIPIVNTWRQRTQFATCQGNLGKMAVAMRLYMRDSDSVLPTAEAWTPALLHYLKDTQTLKCPARSAKIGYDYNSNLSGQKLVLAPGTNAIIFFEASGSDPNASGTDFEWLKPSAHSRGNNVALLNGDVKVLREPPEQKFWIPTGMSQPVVPPAEVFHPKGDQKVEGPGTNAMPGSPPPGAPPDSAGGMPGSTPDGSAGTLPQNPPPPGANPPLPPQPGATGQSANSAP